jgi:type IX secretion system PorP/SprF family membrane protein
MNIALKTKLQLLVPVFLLGSLGLLAQDIHFSQYYNAPLTMNPALTALSKGDIRITSVYRSQWNAANSRYKTFNVAAEKKFYNINHDKWWFSAGLDLAHDQAGFGNLSNNHVLLTGSYTRILDRRNFLSVGASLGLGQRGFDPGNLTFDNMWNGDIVDFNRPTGEDFDNTNFVYPDMGAGVNIRRQWPKKRSKVDFGLGFFHVNSPSQSYYKNKDSSLPMRAAITVLPTFQLKLNGDAVFAATVQQQGEYMEALVNAAYRHYISLQRSKEIAVQFGVGFRFNNKLGDAFMPAVELHYHDLMVGLSWDMNVSAFRTATRRNGGPEIAIRYILHKVYPMKLFKACPLI